MAKKSQPIAQAVDEGEEYTLTELRAEGFKRLKAVRIRPSGAGVLQITGDNDQGKTSVLDAFSAAVGGAAFTPKVPIRKGSREAEVFTDLGALRVTRSWWYDDAEALHSKVVVEYPDGSKAKKPQAVLDELRGSDIAADPLEFMRLTPKQQFDELRKLAPGVDFETIAKERAELFEERTQVGRERDRAKAAADAIVVPQGTPLELVDVTQTVSAMAEANETNNAITRSEENRVRILGMIESKRSEADRLAVQAKTLDKEADILEQQLAGAPPIPKRIDTNEIQQRFSQAETINANVRQLLAQDAYRADFKEKEKRYAALSDTIDKLDKAKVDAVAQLKLPVENMSFGDNELLMNDVPFEEASMANKIRACTAIAMAMKPKLRVILIRDGSLLDANSMKVMADMARDRGFVVLLERVAYGDRVGIVIEDGEVA